MDNRELIKTTLEILNKTKDDGSLNLDLVRDEFEKEANLWSEVTIKLMDLYVKLYSSVEVLKEEDRAELSANIKDTLDKLLDSDGFKYYEEANLKIFDDILEDMKVAHDYGIISDSENSELKAWVEDEIKETKCIKDNVLENFRYVNPEFSFHNHHLRLDGIHFNGLTNDTIINKILDKLYENDASCAQIARTLLDDKGFYTRRVAAILSQGTLIELYINFEHVDGAGRVELVRSGAQIQNASLYNKQEAFDITSDNEAKDPVIERTMNEIFNIMKIIENLG